MIYYPEQPYSARYGGPMITNQDKYTYDPLDARDLVMSQRLGCTMEDIRHLCDDEWVKTHRESVAKLLNIRCDYNSFSMCDRQ